MTRFIFSGLTPSPPRPRGLCHRATACIAPLRCRFPAKINGPSALKSDLFRAKTRKPDTIRLRSRFLLAGMALFDDTAIAQQNTLKEQLIGTWTVVSLINEHKDGSKIETFGSDPKGYFMFDSDGHFSTHILRASRPKFAHRDAPTCAESKAVVEGTITAFG